ncbi:hypothetical protein P3T76_002770 [Phytophthora citrophthora]|uniref:Uncharacterized protein n=1 Tax=Phytophthora citrophthora TaxID=4793 RepID=A0AAD9GVV1_9STRA|nr:hypothetical protein P3T76_002770 [Phytophthora citrophthora]
MNNGIERYYSKKTEVPGYFVSTRFVSHHAQYLLSLSANALDYEGELDAVDVSRLYLPTLMGRRFLPVVER